MIVGLIKRILSKVEVSLIRLESDNIPVGLGTFKRRNKVEYLQNSGKL